MLPRFPGCPNGPGRTSGESFCLWQPSLRPRGLASFIQFPRSVGGNVDSVTPIRPRRLLTQQRVRTLAAGGVVAGAIDTDLSGQTHRHTLQSRRDRRALRVRAHLARLRALDLRAKARTLQELSQRARLTHV